VVDDLVSNNGWKRRASRPTAEDAAESSTGRRFWNFWSAVMPAVGTAGRLTLGDTPAATVASNRPASFSSLRTRLITSN